MLKMSLLLSQLSHTVDPNEPNHSYANITRCCDNIWLQSYVDCGFECGATEALFGWQLRPIFSQSTWHIIPLTSVNLNINIKLIEIALHLYSFLFHESKEIPIYGKL